MASELARVAISYARFGRKVLPLWPGTKQPASAHAVKDATSDVERVAAWWRDTPFANIGLAVLPHELVVDVDVRSGGHDTLSDWTKQYGALPVTPCQITPTEGVHYIFKRPAGFELVAHPGAGVDVLGAGKYIVGAPSSITLDDLRRSMAGAMHLGLAKDFWKFVQAYQTQESNGRTRYEWVRTHRLSTATPATLPAWLAALVLRDPAPAPKPSPQYTRAGADVITRAERWLATCDAAIQGQGGSNTCFRVVTRLVRGFVLDADTALDLLERIYNPKCDPPWSRRELAHKVRQAIKSGNYEWGALRDRERKSA